MISIAEQKEILAPGNMVHHPDEPESYESKCKRIKVMVFHREDDFFEFGTFYDGVWWDSQDSDNPSYEVSNGEISAEDLIFDFLHDVNHRGFTIEARDNGFFAQDSSEQSCWADSVQELHNLIDQYFEQGIFS